jgi:death on curing protein
VPSDEASNLEIADFLLIAESVLGIHADVLARDDRVIALAESALSAPTASFAGEDFYPEFAQRAAILCSRLVRNHALPDGNKRTAYLCMIEFAERNGHRWRTAENAAEEGKVVEMIVQLASGIISETAFVQWVRERLIDPAN